ncbi:type IV pilus assembly protein PilC [Pedobacter steynii]|uniref:General secretion pathway protein F n=1 Tax=Pedobacter steynii TaxID=430522 RepID=A0A1H0ANJ6_9SPHI|nr:type II secretion system F family protein [Pedobacter steynii]NQX41308.1 type II secretion system F family protein [Pedobacter steynii]SDN34959.1 type IV pilus assembly protein PilC [Pedobacter steynii]
MPSIDISQYQKKKRPDAKPEGNDLFAFLNKDISFGSKQVPDKKKESLYVELSTLLLSGIDLRTALELILVDQEQAKDKVLFEGIRARILSGLALSEALKETGQFSDYEFYSIRIGEETGRLGEVLTDLSKYYKSKIQQRRKIVSAVTYPAIVLLSSLGAVFFMIKFVVPMFADVFLRFGGKLPWITGAIISFSNWFDRYFSLFLLFIIAVTVVYFLKRRSEWFRKISSGLLLKIPVVGDIVRKIYLARFANTMRLLVSTDTPLLRSIALVRQMISYYPIESSLLKVEQDILQGESLHKSLASFPFYPAKMIQLIKVGEEVNRMDYFFEKIASQYTEEVEYRTNTISSLLEPLIIIFLGLVVGVILIAMYLPMFQMSNSF